MRIKLLSLLLLGAVYLLSLWNPLKTQAEEEGGAMKAEFVGTETCLSCHTDQTSIHSRKFINVKGIAADRTCETCHGPGSLHVEAGGDKENPGFATIKAFKKLSAPAVSQTCLECHQNNERLHWTGGKHDNKGLSCITCHSIHSPASKKGQLVKATELETCSQCHSNIKAQLRRSSHMPVKEGKMSCTSCHNPHGSSADKSIKGANVNALCYDCHAEKRGPFIWQHPPAMENCLACHAPHGSHNEKMLNAKLPLLCQRCHNFDRHPSTPYGNQEVIDKDDKVFAQSCLNCHATIHGSNHPSGKMFTR